MKVVNATEIDQRFLILAQHLKYTSKGIYMNLSRSYLVTVFAQQGTE